jgi:hypothetical protein
MEKFLMSRIVFQLEEQFSDMRSNEVAYKFTVENHSDNAIVLLDTTTRTPEDVKFSEIKDSSSIALKSTGEELCGQLTILLNTYLTTTSEDFRKREAQATKQILEEVLGFGVFRLYAKMLSNLFTRNILQAPRRLAAYEIQIETYAHAKTAFDRWLSTSDVADIPIRDLFQAKMERLLEIEKETGNDIRSSLLATVEPDSFFAQTYVFNFRRYIVDPRRSNISVEAVYSDADSYEDDPVKAKRYIGSATQTLIISPKPWAVTILAIIASWLGVALRNAISLEPKTLVFPYPLQNFIQSLHSPATASSFQQILAASILALVFYNVYEYTSIGKNFSNGFGISWRNALLIGMLCGLVGDKIIAALKAFLGT